MTFKPRKLVTVVTEAFLEERIVADALRLGARGYTAGEARGQGHRGVRSGDWEASRNVRIEIVCGEAVAHALAEHLLATYYRDFAMILFVTDVEVIRPEKF
ncbi:MAG: P-II family nitrogen regulator [Deferrisomatales bacterium]